jgi:OOP family OmpA-OmpF porin
VSRSERPHVLALVATVTLCLRAAEAGAQASTINGWALDRYEPATAGDAFFANEFPWYDDERRFSAGVTLGVARNPLVLRGPGRDPQAVIDDMVTLHAHGAVALLDRVGLTFSLPFSLVQTAGPASATSGLAAYTGGPLAGDPRVGARVRILGHSDRDRVSLHVGGQLFLGFIPWSGDEHWVTDEVVRGRVSVTLAGRAGPSRYTVSAGFHGRRRTELARVVHDSELFFSAGLALVGLEGRLHVGPECWVAVVPGSFGVAGTDPTVHAEATLGMSYTVANAVSLGIAGGPGLSDAAGTPSFRGLIRLAYAPTTPPPPVDLDGDTVPDAQDQCPAEPRGPRPDASRAGCPAPALDGDRDGVLDADDRCPAEPRGAQPDPARVGCPMPDGDGDGVADAQDACATVPAGRDEDPARPGCPDGDDDADGVRNALDRCRTSAPGATPDPARAGCPAPDRDRDSVPDPIDRCPEQEGVPQREASAHGCPTRVSFNGARFSLREPLRFTARDRAIDPRGLGTIDDLARAISLLPIGPRLFLIEGHADDGEPAATAVERSAHRAELVRDALIARGVAASRVQSVGRGTANPLAPTASLSGAARGEARARNRRIEVLVLDPSPSAVEGPSGSR